MILLTGQEPLGDFEVDPSTGLAGRLDGEKVLGHQIEGTVLPAAAEPAADAIIERIEASEPDAVVATGLAPGATAISIERFGITLGSWLTDPDVDAGSIGFATTLPTGSILEQLDEQDIPAQLSSTAETDRGTHVLYTVLAHFAEARQDVPVGYVYLPMAPRQAIRKSKDPGWLGEMPPSMAMKLQLKGLGTILKCTADVA